MRANFFKTVFILCAGLLNFNAQAASGYAGSWETSFGILVLEEKGDLISGEYNMRGQISQIQGKLEGKRFVFTYKEPSAEGKGWFELSPDGKSFTGSWNQKGQSTWHSWVGQRVDPAKLAKDFTGLWNSDFGRVRLRELPSGEIYGIYRTGSGTGSIQGKRKGNRFEYTYSETASEGSGWFELEAGATSFHGEYASKKDPKKKGPWNGRRMNPIPGLQWLVVLEARWEDYLDKKEYSFGEMLKAYFSRMPNVQVSHRFFTDENSLRHWIQEIAFLPEPVVLSIATHGEENGVSVNGKTIGAKAIADSLVHSPNIILLHFAACLIMKDKVALEIMKQLADRAPFPISGYKNTADWSGSALSEFFYYEMVAARGLSPRKAADLLPSMVPYAGDRAPRDSPFAPLGFTLIEPK